MASLLSLAELPAYTSWFSFRHHAIETSMVTMAAPELFVACLLSLARFVAHTSWFSLRYHAIEPSMVMLSC